jgi:hypothetical protein
MPQNEKDLFKNAEHLADHTEIFSESEEKG